MLTVRDMIAKFNVIRVSDMNGNWCFSDDAPNVEMYLNPDSTHFEVYCHEGEAGINIKILDQLAMGKGIKTLSCR